MKTFKLIMTAALFFVCLSLTAQVNFSGTWAFNMEKSQMGGPGGGPGGPGGGGPGGPGPMGAGAMVVTQDGNNLTVERTMRNREGEEMKMTDKYLLDGQPTENVMFMDMKRKSVVTWSTDKKSITIVSTMNFDGNEMKETAIWKLADDGKSLSIESTRPGRDGEEMKFTSVYDKK